MLSGKTPATDPQPPHPPVEPVAHGMRPRDWFEVGARLLGVWSLMSMVGEMRGIVLFQMDVFPLATRTPLMVYVLHAACDAAVGFYLLFAAGQLAGIVFGNDDRHRGFPVDPTPASSPSSDT